MFRNYPKSVQPAALSPGVINTLSDVSWAILCGLAYLDTNSLWARKNKPVVNVEKGYGSGIFQDLYPHTNGQLYTLSKGRGQTATAFAGASLLLVQVIYNQVRSSVSSGHVTPASATKRVILDLAVPTCPRFRGYNGTNDASQAATIREYDLGISTTMNDPFTMFTVFRPLGTNTLYQTGSGGTPWLRYYQPLGVLYSYPGGSPFTGGAAVPVSFSSPTVSGVRHLPRLSSSTLASAQIWHAGTRYGYDGAVTRSATAVSNFKWFGPNEPLYGYAYALAGTFATDLPDSKFAIGSISSDLLTKANDWAVDEIQIAYPTYYNLWPIDLSTNLADCAVNIISGPGRVIEANLFGRGWTTLGITNSKGVLLGTITGQAVGTGNLVVRVQGQVATYTMGPVAVGISIGYGGQSNMLGMGAGRALTKTIWELNAVVASSSAWLFYYCELLSAAHGNCVVRVDGNAVGGTSLSSGSRNWDRYSLNQVQYWTCVGNLHKLRYAPNRMLWHQGEADTVSSQATHESYVSALIDNIRADMPETASSKLITMGLGVAGDQITYAMIHGWDSLPAKLSPAGCIKHIANDGVHYTTVAEKEAIAAIVFRHTEGVGRGPQISSGSKSGANITLNFTGGVSPIVCSVGELATPIGWTVTDGAGTRTVSSITLTGALQVRLTCDTTLTGSVTVAWMNGNSAVGTTLLDSDATTPVPPEPFSIVI